MSKQVSMRIPSVKIKTANPVQITAEQMLKDTEMHKEQPVIKTDDTIRDKEELEELKAQRRKYFEDRLHLQRQFIGHWIKYATWEESVQEFKRARSVFERALEVDYKNISIWMKYIEMETRHKFLNKARNLYERAIDILPRVEQFWYKYAYMEEITGNYIKARNIFVRWMEWTPPEKAWLSYLAFEQRMKEPENCKKVLYDFMKAHPKISTYLKVAKYEQKQKNYKAAREVFERCLEDLGQEALQEAYFINFAQFEIKNKEFDRAREIFRFGLENIAKEKCAKLYQEYLNFEKQFGQKEEIDELIFNQRRTHYKELIEQNAMNYDAWFDLVNLEIETKHYKRTVDTFEAAIKNVPPIPEKRYWRRYIYIWYTYATWEELDQGNIAKSADIYERALKIVPHKEFTFSKLWIMYAHQQIRCENVDKARKIFGIAIGKCATEKVIQEYIELETQMADIDRVREIYKKYAQVFPDNPIPWIKWAEMERSLDEQERYRQLFEIAIDNPQLTTPETVWRAYIDNEIDEKQYDNVRQLYERLLERTQHLKIWISYAQFEQSLNEQDKCREILQRAEDHFKKNSEQKEERAFLLETWKDIEAKFGVPEKIQDILKRQPKRVIKKRQIVRQEGDVGGEEEAAQEEYYDYVFADDNESKGILKMMERAKQYKKEKLEREKQEKLQKQQQQEEAK